MTDQDVGSGPPLVREKGALLAELFADPPLVHTAPADGSRTHVWHTEPSCYHFMADLVAPSSRTLETGCGISTAMFAGLGAQHTAIFGSQGEADALNAWLARKGIPVDRLTLLLGYSSVVLPTLTETVDLFLIDGGHGFPMPILDWFYGAALLRRGGTLVVDDARLPAVDVLLGFLDADPRWQRIGQGDQWRAYRRESEGPLGEEWVDQRFWRTPREPSVLDRARRKLRRMSSGEGVNLPH